MERVPVRAMAERIPPETVAAVRAAAGMLADGIVEEIRAGNPAYADVLEGPEGIGIRLGIEQAIGAFLDAIERGQTPGGGTAEVWRRLGEAEFQAGRKLDALRAAWRTGTRAAWRGAADLAASAGIPTTTVIALAEAIFVFTDELATDVVEGYLRMQSDEASERERRRRRLAALLLDPDGSDPEALAHAADLARWALPRSLAVLLIGVEAPGAVVRRLDMDALVAAQDGGAVLVVPDPGAPGRAASLRRALSDAGTAVLGPLVAPRDAYRSLRWARIGLDLVRRGALPAKRPVRVMDHLATVMLLQDEEMARALMHARLAPVERLPAAERERLLETLSAWLAHQRHTPRAASELHVHPQTVRYRIGRLRDLLGEGIDTPDGRFEFEVALRARTALRADRRSSADPPSAAMPVKP